MSQPAMSEAAFTAWRIDWTVDSMFTTTPFFMPEEAAVPTPMISTRSSKTSPIMAHTLVVPMSRLATSSPGSRGSCSSTSSSVGL